MEAKWSYVLVGQELWAKIVISQLLPCPPQPPYTDDLISLNASAINLPTLWTKIEDWKKLGKRRKT